MIIQGLQKITLLDFPGKVACTVFTRGCNFRCPFCQNALLVTDIDLSEYIPEDEFFSYLEKRTGVLDGVCITGGEPLINKDIADFIKKIKALGFAVKLDTNGSFPDRLKELLDQNLLDYVAMDIKSSIDRYEQAVGIKFDTESILASVNILKKSGIDHEFRTTVTKELHDTKTICDIAAFIGKGEKWYLQQYKESDNMVGDIMTAYSEDEMKQLQTAASAIHSKTFLRGI